MKRSLHVSSLPAVGGCANSGRSTKSGRWSCTSASRMPFMILFLCILMLWGKRERCVCLPPMLKWMNPSKAPLSLPHFPLRPLPPSPSQAEAGSGSCPWCWPLRPNSTFAHSQKLKTKQTKHVMVFECNRTTSDLTGCLCQCCSNVQ